MDVWHLKSGTFVSPMWCMAPKILLNNLCWYVKDARFIRQWRQKIRKMYLLFLCSSSFSASCMRSSLNIRGQFFFSEPKILWLKMQNMSLPCPTGRCYPEQVDRKLDKCSFCDFLKISGSFKSLSRCYSKELLLPPCQSMIILVEPLYWSKSRFKSQKLKISWSNI